MNIRKKGTIIISTFFYSGYFPFIPGTFASLIGVLLFALVSANPPVYSLLTVVFIFLGFLSGTKAEEILKQKDPKIVVIDEVAGMFLSFLFLPYYDIKVYVLGFLMFRILDTLKAFPAGKLQDLGGSKGIMMDDIIAAIYTNIILQVVFRMPSFIAS